MEDVLKWYSDRKETMMRALALVLISPDHESAVNAAKQAFAELDYSDPFVTGQATEEVRKAS